MMSETLRDSLIILFLCLLNVGDIQAQCERPSVGANRILTEYTDQNIFPDGTTLTYKCSTGYVPVQIESSRTITCKGNQWSKLDLQCTGKSCGSPGELVNGKYLTPDGVQFGATATAQCNEGYIVSGPKTRNCRDFGWDGRPAVCEVLKCFPPSTIPNGMYEPMLEVYDFNQAVQYSCKKDYTLFGEAVISCSDNGTFQPLPPRCLLVTCEAPNIENANRVEGKRPPYGYKNFVRYECVQGYNMKGSGSLVCEVDGWNPPPPTCISDKIEPKPTPIPGPSPTPEPDNKKQKIAIGIGVGLLSVAAVILGVIFFKKRAPWGKVPTGSEGSA